MGSYDELRAALGVSDKRTARLVVGSLAAGWTADDCDYLCDGTDDQAEIQAAVNAMPEWGGEVAILDGTYNITAGVLIKRANITLSGSGSGTVLRRVVGDIFSSFPVISVAFNASDPPDNCHIRDLTIDGNKSNCKHATSFGIDVDDQTDGCRITNVICCDHTADGIRAHSAIVTNCICNGNDRYGIYATGRTIISNNICSDNGETGIKMGTGGSGGIIVGNICKGNATSGIDAQGTAIIEMGNLTLD